jgi:hypothetical protein
MNRQIRKDPRRTGFCAGVLAMALLALVPANPAAAQNGPGVGRADIIQKLQSIVVPKVNFDKLDVAAALDFLHAESKELDPDHQGINFVLDMPPDSPPGTPGRVFHRPVSITLEGVPLIEILRYVCEQTNLRCSVDDYVVYFGAEIAPGASPLDTVNAAAMAAPVPPPPAADNGLGGSVLSQKLDAMIISLDFNNATIEEATNFLHVKSKDADPEHKGVNFMLMPDATTNAAPITLAMNHVPMTEALRYISILGKVRYRFDDSAVVILPE